MKTLFIEARRKLSLDKEKLRELEKLIPSTIYIAYSIQYKELAEKVRKELKNKKILGFSQILGCSKLETDAEAILLIGSGRFHALNLAISSGKEVCIFPELSKIEKSEIEKINLREKGKYAKFLLADRIGVLVSTKPGQDNLTLALKIKKQIESKDKKVYLFITDNINVSEIENFPIDLWVNTACPGLSRDSNKVIDYSKIYLD